jgi:hypothetical protein
VYCSFSKLTATAWGHEYVEGTEAPYIVCVLITAASDIPVLYCPWSMLVCFLYNFASCFRRLAAAMVTVFFHFFVKLIQMHEMCAPVDGIVLYSIPRVFSNCNGME